MNSYLRRWHAAQRSSTGWAPQISLTMCGAACQTLLSVRMQPAARLAAGRCKSAWSLQQRR